MNVSKNVFPEVWWKVETTSDKERENFTLFFQRFKEGELMDPPRHNEYTIK